MVEVVRCIPGKVRETPGHERIISVESLWCNEGRVGSSEGTQGLVRDIPPVTLVVHQVHWIPYREELDREQISIIEEDDCQRSLGLYGDWAYFPAADCFPDWYGGRVLQNARLVLDKPPRKFKIQLEVMEYRKDSTRIARFLGSRRILCLGVAESLLFKDEHGVKQFLNQKFVLCGRVFVALKSKEGKVYLAEVKEDYERQAQQREGDNKRKAFWEIINWHNPMNRNQNQVCFTHRCTLFSVLITYYFRQSRSGLQGLTLGFHPLFQLWSSNHTISL